MDEKSKKLTEILCSEFNLKAWQTENAIALIDDGNTVPFIARYRKEATGSMDDTLLFTNGSWHCGHLRKNVMIRYVL